MADTCWRMNAGRVCRAFETSRRREVDGVKSNAERGSIPKEVAERGCLDKDAAEAATGITLAQAAGRVCRVVEQNVRVGYGGDRSKNAGLHTWSKEHAENYTGIKQYQVSRRRKRLADKPKDQAQFVEWWKENVTIHRGTRTDLNTELVWSGAGGHRWIQF